MIMKKHAVITTYYCYGCEKPSQENLKQKFNFDGNIEDIYVNFSNKFDPFHMETIPNIGISKRKDLVYGKIFISQCLRISRKQSPAKMQVRRVLSSIRLLERRLVIV